MWEQYSSTVLTIGSVIVTVVLAYVAKRYANQYEEALTLIQVIKDALADKKVTKEELEQIVEHGSALFLNDNKPEV